MSEGPSNGTSPPPESLAAKKTPSPAAAAIKMILRLGVAGGIIGYLLYTGAIDPKKVSSALTQPTWIATGLGIVFCTLSIITVRWWLLLKLEGIDIPVTAAFKLTLVGHFWNNILPGSITGDAVKMYYIGSLYPTKRYEAWATVAIDRVIGLAALVFLSFFCALGNLDFIYAKGHEKLQLTFLGNALAAAAFTVSILALVLGVGRKSSFASHLRERLPFADKLRRGYHSLIRLGAAPKILTASFLLGVLSHTLLCWIGVTSGRALGDQTVSVKTYYFLVPVGLFVNSVPIGLPGGIGAGEGAFKLLFEWAGALDAKGESIGANVMLLMRLAQMTWAFVGAAIYVFDRKTLTPKTQEPGMAEKIEPPAAALDAPATH